MAAKKKSPKKPQERNLTRELSMLLAKTLLPDLQARAQEPSVARALAAQYETERKHTANSLAEWTTRTLEQVAVAWILSCVFIRTLEDRGYLTHPRLAGEGAADSEHLFFDLFPSLTQRDYLIAVFRELSHLPGGEEVLAPKHNPAWRLAPTTEAVRTLLAFFREADSEGKLVWSFAGESTRFLGDLYQDVSEAVRERYALLQTPDFVEEFILDLTLDPAIAEFGLEEVRLIDPTCGSGHFLLGAFKRLFEARQRKAPATAAKEHAGAALAQVYGADINPYAAGIARFRLVLAYLRAAGIERLKDAPRISTNVVVADSLLFAADNQTLPFAAMAENATAWGDRHWQFEEPKEVQRIFSKRFHAVVGNPPYITCKDSVLREEYRRAYVSAAGKYALSAPFTERFFQLATESGFVGMINANSFMKREFGKALIEKVLPQFELTRLMDTAGAYIPGHGTPTALLFGQNRAALTDKIVAVLGKRGEPVTPAVPANGLVWSSIRDHFAEPGFDDEYVSVVEVKRATFQKHPWSMGGGGAGELKALIEQRAQNRLVALVESIGFMSISGEDDAFLAPPAVFERHGLPHKKFGVGEVVRDWATQDGDSILFPYDEQWRASLDETTERWLWPYRVLLRQRLMFGKTQLEAGFQWYEYRHVGRDKLRAKLSIAFPFVATHNHFALDRGGKVFNRTAPIIKLPETADEEEHLALLAYLNSSTACFWLKQVFSPKGMHNGSESNATPFLVRFEFDGTKLQTLPVPDLTRWRSALAALAQQLDKLSHERNALTFELAVKDATSATTLAERLQATVARREELRDRMIVVQEDVDWTIYAAFGLLSSDSLSAPSDSTVTARPGTRPFEVHIARLAQDDRRREWFKWNQTVPRSEFEFEDSSQTFNSWSHRLDEIGTNQILELLEAPEVKRRWRQPSGKAAQELQSDEKTIRDQCDAWIAQAIEDLTVKQEVKPCSIRRAFSVLAKNQPLASALCWRWPTTEPELVTTTSFQANSVPYLAALRYSPNGRLKRAEWEHCWEQQRLEDIGVAAVPVVPPKYEPADFAEPSFFRLRGKLDVPKERFISYPGAERDDDKSPLFGWAGWDHLQQATALAGLYHERKMEDGWPAERLVPLLAGLLELVPWLKQWHNEPNDELGGEGPGDWYERYVEAESRSIGKTVQDLRDWRPAKGRGSKAS